MLKRKGIVLAGGHGTRLYPITKALSKQLIPIYDKPMIYYSLSTLMLGDIRDILIISTPQHISQYQDLMGDGSQWGVNLSYEIQKNPGGLAQAFIIGEKFIGKDLISLILGDNLFYGANFKDLLMSANRKTDVASIFAYKVSDPERFGVVDFDKDFKVTSIEEKPKNPKSNYAVTGLYFYNNDVINIAKEIKPSQRGELEITDVNMMYLEQGKLNVEVLGSGFAWLDTGTPESFIEASNFIYTLDKRQGTKILCPEEIAYKNQWITREDILRITSKENNSYNDYLKAIIT